MTRKGNTAMTADSTQACGESKPEPIKDYFARISRSALEREAYSNWEALGDVADVFNDLADGALDDAGFVKRVREIVCDGMGISVQRNEPWRDRVRNMFPCGGGKGDAA